MINFTETAKPPTRFLENILISRKTDDYIINYYVIFTEDNNNLIIIVIFIWRIII